MPQSIANAVTVAAIVLAAIVALCLVWMAVRLARRRRRSSDLNQRDDDQVHYAFIINPSKPQADQTERAIRTFCASKSLTQISFITTQLDKDGRACAMEALEQGADVVVAVGGDGTARTVASALSGTGHAMGLIPIGTGNLFARNMGIPIGDIEAALTVATSHGSRMVDMGRLTMLDREDDRLSHAFLIIAGIGFDALMIDDTDPALKANISWLAYFVSGVRHLFSPKYRATVTVTEAQGRTHTLEHVSFRTLMAGNCGQIPVFSLMPDALYDDGLLDFAVVDTSGGLIGWANLFGNVVHQTITGKTRQNSSSTSSSIEQIQGTGAEVTLERPALVQVDGDTLGQTRHLRFSIERRALCVRVPEGSAFSASAEPSQAAGLP